MEYPLSNLGSGLRVHDLDLADRPREKALLNGVPSLSDAELVALILGTGVEGCSVIDLARHMLSSNDNSLQNLARMSVAEMTSRYKGVGKAKAVNLLAALNLGMRCANAPLVQRQQIRCSKDVFLYFQDKIAYIEHEEFWVLLTNQSNHVKHELKISKGGLTATVVDVRIIMRQALVNACPGIVLAHNHPSGALTPSPQDDGLTRKIAEGCRMFDIRMLDHVIVAGNKYYSYADEGRLPQ